MTQKLQVSTEHDSNFLPKENLHLRFLRLATPLILTRNLPALFPQHHPAPLPEACLPLPLMPELTADMATVVLAERGSR